MARMPNAWEQRIRNEQQERERKAKAERKAAFISRWLVATPEQQAEILFEITEGLASASETAWQAGIHHMRF